MKVKDAMTGESKDIKVTFQADYGVKSEPIWTKVQDKYGVFPTTAIAQPAYGIKPTFIPISQAKYGVPSTTDISMNFDELQQNISTLKSAISTLRNSWSSETKKNLQTLDNSWVGADCKAYTSKLTNMDNKVQKTIEALELLCKTYEKARDMVKEAQASSLSSINGL